MSNRPAPSRRGKAFKFQACLSWSTCLLTLSESGTPDLIPAPLAPKVLFLGNWLSGHLGSLEESPKGWGRGRQAPGNNEAFASSGPCRISVLKLGLRLLCPKEGKNRLSPELPGSREVPREMENSH